MCCTHMNSQSFTEEINYFNKTMKLATTLILVLNLGASTASDKNLHLRGGGDDYARQLSLIERCPADVLVPIGYYDDYDWIELPECVQEAAALFGYNQVAWEKEGNELCPSWCDEWWKDLTEEQKRAAWVFGYNEQRWNSS